MTVLERTSDYLYEDRTYIDTWWRYLAPKFDIGDRAGDLLVHRKPIFKGLLKLNELRLVAWNNAWAQDLTEARVSQLETFGSEKWDCFKMLWTESRTHLQAFDQLTALGYEITQAPAPPQYICDISQGMEAYLKTLSSNSRKSFKKRYRLAEHLNPRLAFIEGEAAIETFFEEFFSLHIPYWNQKEGHSYFNDPHEREFIVQWCRAMDKTGQLVAARMYLNDEPANLSVGIILGKTLYWLLTINTGAYKDFGPGILGLYLNLQDAEKRGIETYNMGSGDYFYKIQAANRIEKCYTLVVPNPRTMKGQAYKAWLARKKEPEQPSEVSILETR